MTGFFYGNMWKRTLLARTLLNAVKKKEDRTRLFRVYKCVEVPETQAQCMGVPTVADVTALAKAGTTKLVAVYFDKATAQTAALPEPKGALVLEGIDHKGGASKSLYFRGYRALFPLLKVGAEGLLMFRAAATQETLKLTDLATAVPATDATKFFVNELAFDLNAERLGLIGSNAEVKAFAEERAREVTSVLALTGEDADDCTPAAEAAHDTPLHYRLSCQAKKLAGELSAQILKDMSAKEMAKKITLNVFGSLSGTVASVNSAGALAGVSSLVESNVASAVSALAIPSKVALAKHFETYLEIIGACKNTMGNGKTVTEVVNMDGSILSCADAVTLEKAASSVFYGLLLLRSLQVKAALSYGA